MSKVTLADVLRSAIRLQPYNFQGAPELLSEEMPGDWVVRTQASDAERLEALSDLLAKSRGLRLQFQNRPTEQEVMVVTGKYAFKPMAGAKNDHLHVFAGEMDRTEGIVRSDPVDRLFNTIAREMRMRFVNQIEGPVPDRIMWEWYDSSRMAIISKSSLERDQRLQKMFEAMGAQMGLKFTRTLQTWDVWHVEKQP